MAPLFLISPAAVSYTHLDVYKRQGLTGPLTGLWRYRIGDWRVVVDIYDDRLVILALDIEHRSRVYR